MVHSFSLFVSRPGDSCLLAIIDQTSSHGRLSPHTKQSGTFGPASHPSREMTIVAVPTGLPHAAHFRALRS
jgi:hypothetical protein